MAGRRNQRVSTIFKLKRSQATSDFVDVDVERDTRVAPSSWGDSVGRGKPEMPLEPTSLAISLKKANEEPVEVRAVQIGVMKSGAILIVEDEPLIRMFAADTLADAGFITLEAGDVREAETVLHQRQDVALIFTDIDLPGESDGLALASRVCAERPEIEIIVTSGEHRLPRDAVPDNGEFLPKPYSPNDLLKLVQDKLA